MNGAWDTPFCYLSGLSGISFITESTHMANVPFSAELSFFTRDVSRELGSPRTGCYSAIVSTVILVARKAPAGRVRQLLPLIIAQYTCTLGTHDGGSHDPASRVFHSGTCFSATKASNTSLSCMHRLCTNITGHKQSMMGRLSNKNERYP